MLRSCMLHRLFQCCGRKSLKRSPITNGCSAGSYHSHKEESQPGKCYHNNSTKQMKEATLYVHWPFCKKLCPYCDFNKYIRRNTDVDIMVDCLVKEVEYFIDKYGINKIKSLYFGGGTPSLAPSYIVSDIVGGIMKNSFISDSAEISLEVNPTSFETEQLRLFKDAGINRVSIGIQSLDNKDLMTLGREHSKEDAFRCFEESMKLFGDRVSIDLMFGRPNQTLFHWERELSVAVGMGSNHMSLYQLTMKKHTPMERLHRRGQLALPSDDVLADMYQFSVEYLQSRGLYRYEVSNFAKFGSESNHNMSYWKNEDYIGIGPGAHGRLSSVTIDNDRHSFIQIPSPEQWIKAVQNKGHGIKQCRKLSKNERITELIVVGLRTREGITENVFNSVVGIPFEEISLLPRVAALQEGNFIIVDNSGIRATDNGLNLLDSVTSEVDIAIEEYLSLS